jgi:hypothetical protein
MLLPQSQNSDGLAAGIQAFLVAGGCFVACHPAWSYPLFFGSIIVTFILVGTARCLRTSWGPRLLLLGLMIAALLGTLELPVIGLQLLLAAGAVNMMGRLSHDFYLRPSPDISP